MGRRGIFNRSQQQQIRTASHELQHIERRVLRQATDAPYGSPMYDLEEITVERNTIAGLEDYFGDSLSSSVRGESSSQINYWL
jgi:hypothetical protein